MSTLCHPKASRFTKTYNYYDSAEVSSAFQKSVRRGHLEACHWALELYWTGPRQRTNIWNRILVTSVEDIGLACPELIVHLLRLRQVDQQVEWGLGHYLAVARAAELCVKARKSRLADLLAHRYSFKENIPDSIKSYPPEVAQRRLMDAIYGRRLDESLIWAEYLWCTPEPIPRRYKRAGWLVWEALEETLEGLARQLLPPLKELGMSPNWRWQRKTRLLWIHLILLQLYEPLLGPEAQLHQLKEMSLHDLKAMTARTYRRVDLPPIPDCALDKHTLRGLAMGRGLQHFLEVGARIENSAPEIDQLQQQLGL